MANFHGPRAEICLVGLEYIFEKFHARHTIADKIKFFGYPRLTVYNITHYHVISEGFKEGLFTQIGEKTGRLQTISKIRKNAFVIILIY